MPKSFTGASGLHILMYTLEGFDGKNNMTFTGSIYADSIDAKNTFTISGSDVLKTDGPTGFTWDFCRRAPSDRPDAVAGSRPAERRPDHAEPSTRWRAVSGRRGDDPVELVDRGRR